MKRLLTTCLATLLATSFAACTQSPKSEEKAKPTTPHAAPSATTTSAASATSAGAADSAQGGASAANLAGSTWQVDKFVLDFASDKDMIVRGGPVEGIAPNGLTATYSVEKGIFRAFALGKTYTGTWDGTNLVVDGQVGVRK